MSKKKTHRSAWRQATPARRLGASTAGVTDRAREEQVAPLATRVDAHVAADDMGRAEGVCVCVLRGQ